MINNIAAEIVKLIISVVLAAGMIQACTPDPPPPPPDNSPEIKRISDEVIKIRARLAMVRGDIKYLAAALAKRNGNAHTVTATAYSPVPEQTDSTPWETAILTRPVEGRTIAVSQDHVDWLGRKVYIPGYGVRYVEDLMNARFKDRIDFFIESTREAADFGVKKLQIILLE